jgi:hypothetical protein
MRTLFGAAALVLSCATVATAQGVQTGALTGTVVDQTRLVLPGVAVTATSPALQGVRVARKPTGTASTGCPGCPPASIPSASS